jgi:hypothetical protein
VALALRKTAGFVVGFQNVSGAMKRIVMTAVHALM